MRISACMIAKNEEKNIAKCINSYKDIVDEIIVIDTGSTDRTVQIAESLGATLYFFEWINDFSKAKNYALSRAKGDWIIFLDADEYFDQNKARNIPKLIKKYGHGNTEIIACKMYNIDEETGENLADFPQTRIFKNSGGLHYVSAIHERLSSKKKTINAVYIEENELVIYHTGYSQDRIIAKAERNLELLLIEINKPKVDPSMYHFLSDTYLTLKEYDKSIEFARKFLENRIKLEGLNNKVYQNLISSMIEKKYEWSDIYKVIEDAVTEFPDHPMFQLYLAKTNHFTKKYEEALVCYHKTIELQEKYKGIEINFVTGKIHEIEYPMAVIYEDKNDEGAALEYYIKALKRKNDYPPALQNLIKLISGIDEIESIELINKIYDRNNKEELSILIDEITKQRCGKLLAYYVTQMSEKFGHQDFSMVIMFLTNGQYEQAYKHFFEAYRISYEKSYAKLAIISAYLYNNNQALLEIKNIVKPSYKRIIESIIQKDDEAIMYKEDLSDYLGILEEIIKLRNEIFIDRFIELKRYFAETVVNLEVTIGDQLKENRFYEKAIIQYREALTLKITEKKEEKYLYFSTGYCYYKLRNQVQAIICFEKALAAGYSENDLREFLQWTGEQTDDQGIKTSVQELINRFKDMSQEKLIAIT